MDFLPSCHLTVCVNGVLADVDNAWDQRKLEARKMLENAAESPASSARFVRQKVHCEVIEWNYILHTV